MNGYRGLDAERLAHCLFLEEAMACASDAAEVAALLEQGLAALVPGARGVSCRLVAGGDAVPDGGYEPGPLCWREERGEACLLLEVRTNSCAYGSLEFIVVRKEAVIPYEPFLCHLTSVVARQLEGFLVRELFQQSLQRLQGELDAHAADLALVARQRRRLDQLEELARIGLWELDPVSDRVRVSHGFARLAGWGAGEYTRADLLAAIHPRERETFRTALERLTRGGGVSPLSMEHHLLRGDGGVRAVVSHGQRERDDKGAPGAVVCLVRDSTGESALRHRLEQAENTLGILWGNVDEGVARLDPGGRILEANAAFHALLGYAPGECVALALDQLTPERWRALDDYLAQNRGVLDEYTKEFIRKDGSLAPVAVRLWAEPVGDGGMPTVLLLARDLTPQRQRQILEQERCRIESASRAKGLFLAAMSHDIRTPLNAILGIAELLREGDPTPRQQGLLGILQSAGDSLLDLVNDILDLSKAEYGELSLHTEPFNLEELIRETLAMLGVRAREKGVALIHQWPPGLLPRVTGDPRRVRQILVNVVGNAIKFTERGEVTLAVELAPGEASPARARARLLRFVVRDTGIGIPPEQVEGLFEPFVQGESAGAVPGTGLGLAISKRLVTLMGGRIGVESAPGQGSVFHFTLRLPPTLHPMPSLGGEGAVRLRGRRILLVDDDTTSRFILREILSAAGAEVTVMARCASGLVSTLLEEGCDLLLLDHHLPGRSGLDIAEEVLTAAPDKRRAICLLCSDLQGGVRTRAAQLGIPLLVRPVKREVLLATLAQLLALPLSPPRDVRADHGKAVDWRGRCILLAEDSPDIAFLVQAFLKGTGVAVTAVENGEQAVARFRGEMFDLVLMDMQMPVMDGYEAARAIRCWEREQGRAPTPIIALTAHTLVGDADRCLEAGCDRHLGKPVRKAKLLEVVGSYWP